MPTASSSIPAFALLAFSMVAALRAEACSITLVSAQSTSYQGYCVATPNTAILPVVYVIDDTGYDLSGLPPGVTSAFSNDTLTISGTLSTIGEWPYTITTDNGCDAQGGFQLTQLIDPALSCSVDGQNVTLAWLEELESATVDGNLSLIWEYAGQFGSEVLFLPVSPSWFTLSDIPPNTEVHFYWSLVESFPFCYDGLAEITCSTTPLGVGENGQADLHLWPNPVLQSMQFADAGTIDQVRFFDVLGHEVGLRMVQLRSGQVDVSSLSPGVYTAQVKSNGKATVLRFVKE